MAGSAVICYSQLEWWKKMPVCPFCRKTVEPTAIWCSCGTNLSRLETLPVEIGDVTRWLSEHAPETLATNVDSSDLIKQAKQILVGDQDKEATAEARDAADVVKAKQLITEFLADCQREGLAPTIDIGQLRRERWKLWKKVPAESRVHAPLKQFKPTPGYVITFTIAKHVEELCLAVDGTLYKHQFNAPDPFPIEQLVKLVSLPKLAEGLVLVGVGLLKTRQRPPGAAEQSAGKRKLLPSFWRRTESGASEAGEQAVDEIGPATTQPSTAEEKTT